ncbi:MAG TPA: hypothetical protein VLZ06_05675 [Solirubrobacteraceae bacterium]|nr:hypothetical protein [Solirubrobacteraceae bacterium]
MAGSSSRASRAGQRLDSLPLAELLQGAIAAVSRWIRLSPKERSRLLGLLVESKGVVTRLSPKERKELRRLLGKLDLAGLSRELSGLTRDWRKRGGRGRRRAR